MMDNSITNNGLFIPTIKSSGQKQMDLDLYFLNKTIHDNQISFTLRFYLWDGDWLSTGYHQKDLPDKWIKLRDKGLINIVKRPSGGGAVLHSGGITYALTFKKPLYKKLSYKFTNDWLIRSFSKLNLKLKPGTTKKSSIRQNCFSSSYTTDLIDHNGYKRIGSAQYWKNGSFLQHGEIQINPPQKLWTDIFSDNAPPPINFNLTKKEIIASLKESFLEINDEVNIKEYLLEIL